LSPDKRFTTRHNYHNEHRAFTHDGLHKNLFELLGEKKIRLHCSNESIICGNKMPTRCNRGFYCRSYCLLNMFSGTTMPIIRSSRVLYSY